MPCLTPFLGWRINCSWLGVYIIKNGFRWIGLENHCVKRADTFGENCVGRPETSRHKSLHLRQFCLLRLGERRSVRDSDVLTDSDVPDACDNQPVAGPPARNSPESQATTQYGRSKLVSPGPETRSGFLARSTNHGSLAR